MTPKSKPTMTPIHAILVVIIRLWAAGMIFYALNNTGAYLHHFLNSKDIWKEFYMPTVYGLLISLVMGLIAWVMAPKFARMVFPASDNSQVHLKWGADDLVMIGSFLIGGFYLIELVPSLFSQGLSLFIELAKDDPDKNISQARSLYLYKGTILDLLSKLFTVVVALFLTFRPKMLAHMFSSLRSVGLYKIEKPE